MKHNILNLLGRGARVRTEDLMLPKPQTPQQRGNKSNDIADTYCGFFARLRSFITKTPQWSPAILLLLFLSCGGGGPTESPAPPSDTATMVTMFGTSLTAGENATGMAYVLGRHEKEFNIWIRNRGWGGHSSAMLLDHLQDAVDIKAPIVFIEAVMNDASESAELHVELEDTRLYLTEMVRAFQAYGAEVYLMTTNPEMHDPTRHPNLVAYYQITREVAWDTGAHLLDLYPLWLRYSTGELHEMIPDHVHPTNAALETVVVPELQRILEAI